MHRRTSGALLLLFFTSAMGHSSHEGFESPCGSLSFWLKGMALQTLFPASQPDFLRVGVIAVCGVLVHLLRVLLEADHREASVVACSRRFAAIEMPDAAIMGVGGGSSTLHCEGVCELPLERRRRRQG